MIDTHNPKSLGLAVGSEIEVYTKAMEERIKYMENVNRWSVEALDLATSMGELYASTNASSTELLSVTREHLNRFVKFRGMAFSMGDGEDLEFKIEVPARGRHV